MVKFPEANQRMFKDVFVCRKCKKRIRTRAQKIIKKEIICAKCGCKTFRPVRKLRVIGK